MRAMNKIVRIYSHRLATRGPTASELVDIALRCPDFVGDLPPFDSATPQQIALHAENCALQAADIWFDDRDEAPEPEHYNVETLARVREELTALARLRVAQLRDEAHAEDAAQSTDRSWEPCP